MASIKQLAKWSRNHIALARLLIVLLHIAIGVICCYVGIALSKLNIQIPVGFFWLAVCVFFSLSFLFRTFINRSTSFTARKFTEGLVLLSVMAMTIVSSNQKTTAHFAFDTQLQGSLMKSKVKADTPVEIRQLLNPDPSTKKGPSAGAVIAVILMLLILSGVTIALACSLTCTGQGALAILVFLLGMSVMFFLGRLIFTGSIKRRNKVKAPTQ